MASNRACPLCNFCADDDEGMFCCSTCGNTHGQRHHARCRKIPYRIGNGNGVDGTKKMSIKEVGNGVDGTQKMAQFDDFVENKFRAGCALAAFLLCYIICSFSQMPLINLSYAAIATGGLMAATGFKVDHGHFAMALESLSVEFCKMLVPIAMWENPIKSCVALMALYALSVILSWVSMTTLWLLVISALFIKHFFKDQVDEAIKHASTLLGKRPGSEPSKEL